MKHAFKQVLSVYGQVNMVGLKPALNYGVLCVEFNTSLIFESQGDSIVCSYSNLPVIRPAVKGSSFFFICP